MLLHAGVLFNEQRLINGGQTSLNYEAKKVAQLSAAVASGLCSRRTTENVARFSLGGAFLSCRASCHASHILHGGGGLACAAHAGDAGEVDAAEAQAA